MLGKIEGRRKTGHQRMRRLDGITDAMDLNLGRLREMVGAGGLGMLQSVGSQRVGHDWETEQQQRLSILDSNSYILLSLDSIYLIPLGFLDL